MKFTRFLVVGGVAASALLALQTSSTQAIAESPAQGPVLVTGRVTAEVAGRQAEPVNDANVYAWWVPGLASAKPGDALAVETVGVTQADANGDYSLIVNPTAAMRRESAANGGWVNLDVGTVSPDLASSDHASISRRLVEGKWTASSSASSSALRIEGSVTGPEAPEVPEALEATMDFTLTEESTYAPAGMDLRSSMSAGGPIYCNFMVTATPQRTVRIVEFHNATNSDAYWKYGTRADSDIEAGVDVGGDGGWAIDGTVHMSNSQGATIARNYSGGEAANNYGRTDFKVTEGYWKHVWGGAPYPGQRCAQTSIVIGTKEKKTTSWEGGVSNDQAAGSEFIGCSNAPQSGNRTAYPAGSSLTRSTGNAAQIGVAGDFGPFKVGAKSGYSTDMDMHWSSVRRTGIWLCGTNSGATTAGVVHVQNRP